MKKIIFTFILALIVIIACEKVKQSAPKAFNTKVIAQPARAKTKKVETKVYKNIESSQLALIIKNFKATALNIQNHQAKLVENDSIPLDSAIWVIEAALNYEYDYDLEGAYEFSRTDTLVIPIPLNEDNLNVNSDDIEDAYLAFSSSLSDSSGSNYKIKYVDLEGYVYDPGEGVANLILKVVNYLSTYGANCPVTGPYSSTSNYKSMTNVEWNSLLGGPGSCGTNSLPEAVTALNVYRNCRSISHLCPPHMNKRGYYHSVVNNPNAFDGGVGGGISGNPYPGELWCTNTHFSYAAAGNWWCNQSNTTLSGTQLNTYLFNQISHANSSVSYPVEVTDRIIHSQVLYVSTFDGTCNCMVGYPYQYWYMELTTGVFTCHEPYE